MRDAALKMHRLTDAEAELDWLGRQGPDLATIW
jgi:hypothetical protein